jgi:hypothetical protein
MSRKRMKWKAKREDEKWNETNTMHRSHARLQLLCNTHLRLV